MWNPILIYTPKNFQIWHTLAQFVYHSVGICVAAACWQFFHYLAKKITLPIKSSSSFPSGLLSLGIGKVENKINFQEKQFLIEFGLLLWDLLGT